MKCYICKKNLGKEAKEIVFIEIGSKLMGRYIHRKECKRSE